MTILAVNWVNASLVALISFSLVIIVLALLIGVIKIFGKVFAEKTATLNATQTQSSAVAADAMSEEEVVAIAMALHLFYNHHDEESDVLTFRHDQGITPWTIKAISKPLK
ncbi:MAG: OadG family protein [Alistipes sp.]|nr:OadG family protein [Alistipes sp.]MDE6862301.1 OadG family protein [Alistipes sp.]MDE7129841.1 OadG family protein [Alistipes sp.]